MENRKPQTANRKPLPCGHVCSLQFTFEPQEGLLAVSDLRQSFLPLEMVQPAFKGTNYLLYPFAVVCWTFDLESMNYSCCLGDESENSRKCPKFLQKSRKETRAILQQHRSYWRMKVARYSF